ncbi:uncharacterized protein LOC141686138 [Apium graveolens]|uniref:uncharacterized protein LOC141686138 n=1 Tax=Apium graveolens TaxID=4045 RepID=UPI003D79AD01
MATGGRYTFADMQKTLFLHPSDGPLSVSIPKLQGFGDYRSWKRSFEIQLSSKRKLGFVNGTVARSTTSEAEATQWDTCNNLLESLWEEIESMNSLPTLTTITPEIANFLAAINTMKEEAKLFQFLNGLDDKYGAQRSQLLMMNPLPTVEMACLSIQQEEAQKDVSRNTDNYAVEASAMYSSISGDRFVDKGVCTVCGAKGHSGERCWTIMGYPKWHHKHKKLAAKGTSKPNAHRTNSARMSNNAQSSFGRDDVHITSQQLEQLLKLLPGKYSESGRGSETDEELECGFSGMVLSCMLEKGCGY